MLKKLAARFQPIFGSMLNSMKRFINKSSNPLMIVLIVLGMILLFGLFLVVVFGLFALILLPIYFVLWEVWIHLLPVVWPTGPEQFIHPGFWIFSGCVLLLGWLRGLLFGNSGTSSK